MAQRPTADFNIDPNITSGTDLANILNRFQDAIDSGNSGASRPAYLAAGGLWVREGDPMRLYLYDGTTDRELYNTTDGIVGAIEDGTVDGQITTWNASSGEWTPEGAVIVDANGNVGIGTDSPSRRLTVLSASGVPLEVQSTAANSLVSFFDANTGMRPSIGSIGNDLIVNTGRTGQTSLERMRIDASGNVGINTDTPEAKLHIRDLIPSIIFDDQGFATRKARLQSKDANLDIEADYNNGTDYSRMTFRVDNDEKMRLDFRGRLGVGGEPSRSTKEIEEEAEATLRNWGTKDKKPTKAELVKRLTERDIGGGNALLQVAGDGYFSGTVYANGSPLTRVGDIIETFRTLKNAVSDETTVEGIKEALTNSLGGLIEKFEAMQSAATQEIES